MGTLIRQPRFCQVDHLHRPEDGFREDSGQSADGQLEVSNLTRLAGKDMGILWQVKDSSQGSVKADSNKASYQAPVVQRNTREVSSPHKSITCALVNFGIPGADAYRSLGTEKGASIPLSGETWKSKCDNEHQRSVTDVPTNQPPDWSLFSHSLGWELKGDIRNCETQRDVLGTVPYTNVVAGIQNGPKASPPLQMCENPFQFSSCLDSQHTSPKVWQLSPDTAAAGPHEHNNSPKGSETCHSGHCEAARIRHGMRH